MYWIVKLETRDPGDMVAKVGFQVPGKTTRESPWQPFIKKFFGFLGTRYEKFNVFLYDITFPDEDEA